MTSVTAGLADQPASIRVDPALLAGLLTLARSTADWQAQDPGSTPDFRWARLFLHHRRNGPAGLRSLLHPDRVAALRGWRTPGPGRVSALFAAAVQRSWAGRCRRVGGRGGDPRLQIHCIFPGNVRGARRAGGPGPLRHDAASGPLASLEAVALPEEVFWLTAAAPNGCAASISGSWRAATAPVDARRPALNGTCCSLA